MAIQYQVYFKIPGGDWLNVENTYELHYTISPAIQSLLDYMSVYEWRVDTYDTETELTTTGDTWTFVSETSHSFTTFNRRSDYDEDLIWQPGVGWVGIEDFEYTGGGRYKTRLLVVGHGVIYYGSL